MVVSPEMELLPPERRRALRLLKAGMACQIEKEIANGWMNQGRAKILSTILVVE